MQKVSQYIISDLLRNRLIQGYVLLLATVGWGIFMLESQPEKALLIIMQVTLFALPLIALVFAVVYFYNSQDFIVLLLAQPIARATVLGGFYLGLCGALVAGFLLSIGLPLLLFYPAAESLLLILSGGLLIFVFVAIALFISTVVSDKARGMGLALLLWAFFAFVYDGLLLFFMYHLGEYPIEPGVLTLSFFNPIDIARITIIMKTEASALLGLSGALFRDFFGSFRGVIVSLAALLLWIAIPYYLVHRRFLQKDM
ncbi:ABC transporter permease subunit [Tunicatimonas pelagia]|uniref:ABC transporter permease subunit n=1 Tax=Tunicatimonas pelagia TaxID=931531 RepID=UPI002666AEA8|nr:ABC transporter permease subunit [Tunicatimonas pelagia]WKN46415.1 ABC transporter permease subunit [Tunicatimonas pelagia]